MRLVIDNVQMEYLRFGKGSKTLIMIQGLNTNGIKGAGPGLAYMYRAFAKEYTVYLFDRRENIENDITVRELAQDIAMAMDELGIKKADIFGVSQGGMIAQYLAMDRPDLVNRMVLAVTLARNNEVVESTIRNWIQLTEAGNIKTLVADMAEKLYSDDYLKRYKIFLPLLTLIQKPKDPKRFIRLAESCLTCNTYDELEKIQCPVLVLGGGKDKIAGTDAAEELAAKLGCEKYIYEELGHAVYEEAKGFNERVLRFLLAKTSEIL